MGRKQQEALEELAIRFLSSSVDNEASFTKRLATELERTSGQALPKLSLTEAHVIDALGKDPTTTASAIAASLGITRGGVSKIVARLQDKGYLAIKPKDGNRKERLLVLTENGQFAFEAHERLHERKVRQLADLMASYTDAELDVIRRALSDLIALESEGDDQDSLACGFLVSK